MIVSRPWSKKDRRKLTRAFRNMGQWKYERGLTFLILEPKTWPDVKERVKKLGATEFTSEHSHAWPCDTERTTFNVGEIGVCVSGPADNASHNVIIEHGYCQWIEAEPCSTCGGEGYVEDSQSVPYGDTWVSMPVSYECEDCLGEDKCPRCGYELDDDGHCWSCAWDKEKQR